MPFFHIAIDVIERDWLTVEAPDLKTAYRWGLTRAAEVYKQRKHPSFDKDIEFASDIDPVPPDEEKCYEVTARLNGNGEEIENAK